MRAAAFALVLIGVNQRRIFLGDTAQIGALAIAERFNDVAEQLIERPHQSFEIGARLGVGERQDEPRPPTPERAGVRVVEARNESDIRASCNLNEESHDAKRLASPLGVADTIARAKKIEGVEVVLSGESELDDVGELRAVLRVAVGDEAGGPRAVRLLDLEALQRF